MAKVPGTKGLNLDESLIFERSRKGRTGFSLPVEDQDLREISTSHVPAPLERKDGLDFLPSVSEVDVVRHFTRLSSWNYGVDSGMYPLGSCTMKYNPKISEAAARRPGFANLHPLAPESLSQGALQLMYELQQFLAEIGGFAAVTLQPAAGAHGELTGIKMVRAFHLDVHGRPRKKVIIPDTAHGTNPASSALNGYEVVEISSGDDGVLHAEQVREAMDEEVAALMLTNPNTLGLFEEHIAEIAGIVHEKGGLLYCDGANMNALLGKARPGDMGVDVLQFNLHKTFSTPHGGGGPGSGPVGVGKVLEPYLPVPVVTHKGDRYHLDNDRPKSVGKMRSFFGNFGVMVRAYTYLLEMGPAGLTRAAELAVLNANYVKSRLEKYYHLPYKKICMHECVLSDKMQKANGVKTIDIAKRLIDLGFHPPTIYFPLVVDGAMMIEPTETESLESLESFVSAMKQIAKEAKTDPGIVKSAPHNTRLSRLDETLAARNPVLTWSKHD
ncbi:MAG: glycine dehydrogenase subunit 2 [Deltaproteobacteria bacterium]|nr:glycine dehydrogenase subunit 2 [Deltaproteobacteria bacterium]